MSVRLLVSDSERELCQAGGNGACTAQGLTHQIRTVKREMRVLGLDTCRKGEVFGAVIRGGWFLDGVVRFGLGRPAEQQLAENVRATKYYPELRAIMLHDPGNHLGHGGPEAMVGLPVIAVSNAREVPKEYFVFRSERGT